jgi:hypothetical protein
VAQQKEEGERKRGPHTHYAKEAMVGGNLHTYGWGISFRHAKQLTVKKQRILEAQFIGIKHPKEKRKRNERLQPIACINASPSAYIYGKQNSFFTLRAGYGKMRVLAQKAEKNGVQVRLFYGGGASIGLLKPYYVDVAFNITNDPPCYVESQKYDPEQPYAGNEFLQHQRIYGSSGFGRGLGEIKPHPGAYGKIGLNFEWASYNDLVKAVEVGAILDAYYKSVPIMAEVRNYQFYPSLYIDVLMGWRW